jgi:activating signal cointegrator complex subunit 3
MQALEQCKMVRYDVKSGNLYMTELGRVASHFYIQHTSIDIINHNLKPVMTHQEVFHLIAQCAEFESLKARDEEVPDLEKLRDSVCPLPLSSKDGKPALGNRETKVQVLIQVRA